MDDIILWCRLERGLAPQWRQVIVAGLRTRFLPESGGETVQQVAENRSVHIARQIVHEQPVRVRGLPSDDGQVDGVEPGAGGRLAEQHSVKRLPGVQHELDGTPDEGGHADR